MLAAAESTSGKVTVVAMIRLSEIEPVEVAEAVRKDW